MRRILLTFLISLLFIPFISFGQSTEKINTFHSDITINADATVDVSEKIEYDFGSPFEDRHGIFRDIPFKYYIEGEKTRLTEITGISVTDENGQGYNFTHSKTGGALRLKVGHEDIHVRGVKTYIIKYKTVGAFNYFDTYDELYWNVIGDGWDVPISNATANLTLPQGVAKDDLQISCYFGEYGSQNECDIYGNQGDIIKEVSYGPASLDTYEAMSVAVGFPKGTVAYVEPIYEKEFFETILGKIWLGVNLVAPFAISLFFIILWRRRGRDPKGRGTVVAQFDAPDNMPPAEVGAIIDEKVDLKEISATIIDLAIKGYLKIKNVQTGKIIKKKDYELEKLRDAKGLKGEYYETIFNGLFKDSDKKVKMSSLKGTFYKDVKTAETQMYETVTGGGYFSKNPKKTRNIYLGIAIGIIFIGFIIMPGVFLGGIVALIFSYKMPVKTVKGVHAQEHILGLKDYLTIAEKDRLKFHNAPEKNPETFEKFLPYAMVLGVEKQWANQFEGIYKEPPDWYSDPTMRTFSTVGFMNSMNSFTSSASAASVSPSSAAGGGSSFSGGGFSGGGFSGGGGGSW